MANPLDTDAGTELFKHYETEYQLVQADLVQKLDQIADLSGEPRKAALSAAERALEETQELLDQMDMEKQNIPSAHRAAITRRLRNYKSDIDAHRRKLRSLADDRSALFGARYTDDPAGPSRDPHFEQRQQLLAGTERLDRSTQRLKASQALANETEAIGANTLVQLQQQREGILRTTQVLYESEGYVDRSIKSLKGIAPPSDFPNSHPNILSDEEDPDADELAEQPETVNSRRDPAARLDRSRARAALKLKSAFERIFEKYERDFTGVADEIDLRTGRIVVDNGHVRALGDAPLGGGDEEDDGEEEEDGEDGKDKGGGDDATPLDEGDKSLKGKDGKRLGGHGQNAPQPLMQTEPPPLPPPPFFAGGWPGAGVGPFPGAHPAAFPGLMYPGPMMAGFGGFPMMPYGPPVPMPTTDPMWKAPDLPVPSPYASHALMAGGQGTAGSVKKKKVARLSLSTAHEQTDEGADDILLDAAPSVVDGSSTPAPADAVKHKVLLPRPQPEKGSAKKKQKGPKQSAKRTGQIAKKPERQRDLASAEAQRVDEAEDTAPTPEPGHGLDEPFKESTTEQTPASIGAPQADSTQPEIPERSLAIFEQEPELDPHHPDVYVSFSSEEATLCRKPRNRILQVEIPAEKPPGFSAYRIVTSEPDERDSGAMDESSRSNFTTAEIQDVAETVGEEDPKPMTESFSRNVIDPAYAFSDEDEPSIPRWRIEKPKPKAKATKARTAQTSVLREISQNVDPGSADGSKTGRQSPAQKNDEFSTGRAQQLSSSPQLGEVGVSSGALPQGSADRKYALLARPGALTDIDRPNLEA
ncbi:hypothetical protein VTJ49DRAFT_5311 [Mycothermus thermophilus]|uniref:Vesicle transport v-SNARE N-terminal domain-containing protein n=1 Tax=Humicola insolens TaxID=85995 RepID=A0ABR3V3L6_HUMIN